MNSPETSINTHKKPPDKFKCCERFDNFSNEGCNLIDHLSSHIIAINSTFDNDLSPTIQRGEFSSLPKLCPGCQTSDLFGDLQRHPLFQTNVNTWTPHNEVFREKLIEAVNTHIVSCPYLVRMGELIAEMKNSANSDDKTDMAVGSPKMNSTQESGCDNYQAVNISSQDKLESNKDDLDLVSKRCRNKKTFKKFASDLEVRGGQRSEDNCQGNEKMDLCYVDDDFDFFYPKEYFDGSNNTEMRNVDIDAIDRSNEETENAGLHES